MKIQPLYDRLLIQPILRGSVSKGGLLLPQIATNKLPFAYGDVIEAGTGRVNAEGKTVPLTCKPGDVVAYAKNAGLDVPIEDEAGERIMRLVEERYVLGIVTGLPRETAITGLDGRLMQMIPGSQARPDVAYENTEKTEIARREGWLDVNPDGTDDHHDNETPIES